MNRPDTAKIAKIRSAGFLAKGIVYILLGTLTFLAVFNAGGDISDRNNVLEFLLGLPFGRILLGITALGLLAYALWRFYQAFINPDGTEEGEKMKTVFKRIRYFYSGALYGTIAFSFGNPLIAAILGNRYADDNSEENGEKKAVLWELLSQDWGKVVIWAIAIVVALQALQQFYLVYTANFMKKLDENPNLKKEYALIKNLGRTGYFSRGVVFGILSFFIIQVILQHNADAYKGTKGALYFLLDFSYGPFLLGAVALGLTGYGVFNVMVSRYADLTRLR